MNVKLNWQKTSPKPDDDLLAHAITYADKINDPRLPLLIELNGYDPETSTGTPRWGWRSYSFTMKALNSLGRADEAMKLGQTYLKLGIVDGDTNKVLQDLGSIMRENGQKAEAVKMLTDWLAANPYAPAPQILTALLDWEETADTETLIAWATRGLRDLAEEQASTNHGNFYYRRALARDKRALDAIALPERYPALDICDEISRALADYDSAWGMDINPGLHRQIEFRKKTLSRAARDIGCEGSDDPSQTGMEEPTGSASESGSRFGQRPGRMEDEVTQALQDLLPIIANDDLAIQEKVSRARQVLNRLSPIARDVLLTNLRRVSTEDNAPENLRIDLQSFLAAYSD